MKISLLFLFIITGFQAQTISKQVIGPTGVNFENITNKISYTLGELMSYKFLTHSSIKVDFNLMSLRVGELFVFTVHWQLILDIKYRKLSSDICS